jgi:hypothetical protein
LFLAPNGMTTNLSELVIGDLLKVTGGMQSPAQFDAVNRIDTEATLIAIGRAEVWHHINQMLNLPDRTALSLVQDAIHIGVEHDRQPE